jgi:hypothetical protein
LYQQTKSARSEAERDLMHGQNELGKRVSENEELKKDFVKLEKKFDRLNRKYLN